MKKVSFKVSKRGTRYLPKPKPNPSLVFVDNEVDDAPTVNYQLRPRVQNDVSYSKKRSVVDLTEDGDDDDNIDEISDADVSFIVNIFPDGYTIDKSFKSNAAYQIASKYDPKLLYPYDRESQSLFAAIECCQVPANFFDDIPCKYKNGKVACEVRDWRKDSSEPGVSTNGPSIAATPSIRRISLKMSLDSIVRDIPQLISKRNWAYGELVEAEAKILLALYPKIDLHPYPNFERLCKKPTTVKLNLDFRAMRRKRLRQMSVPEKSNLGTDDSKPMMDQPSVANLATQNVSQRPAMDQPHSVNLATQNAGQRPAMDQTNSVNLATQNACQRTTMDQPNFVNLASQNVGQRSMGQPNVCNLATQNVGQGPAMDQTNSVNLATQNVSQRPTLDQPNVVNLATQNVGQRPTLDQPNGVNLATHNVGQRLAMDQPNVVNLATQNVGQCNTTVPSPINHAPDTSIPTFPWVSHQPKDQFGVETRGHMQSHAPGTAFNAPGASSNDMVNLSSGNDGINSFMSAFEGAMGNQDGQSSSMANSDYINRSNPLFFVGNQQQKIASHNALGASSTGASSPHAMQSSSSIMSAFDCKWGNQDRQSSSMANSNIGNWSDPLALIGNNQQMTLEILDNTPGTAFNALRVSSTRSMSLPSANHGIRSHVSAFDSRSRSNSLVYLGNQQQQLASDMQYNVARTSVNAPGASSINGMVSLNSNNGGISSIIPFDGNKGNQDGHSSSVANMDNRNWSNPLAEVVNQHQLIPLHNRNTSGTAFSAPGLDAKSGSEDGRSSFMANADNGNQSYSLAAVGNQQQQTEASNMQYNASQTAANVPGASSAQGTVSLSSDDDGIWSIMDLQDGNCPPMANADNNQSNPLAFVGYQKQQIAASPMQNQQHGTMSSGSDNDGLWSIVSAFDNKRGHQDGQSSSVANLNKRNRLNPLDFNGNQLQQMGSSHMVSSNAPDSRWKNTLIQQQSTGGVVQHPYANAPTQKQHRYQMLDAICNPNIGQQGIRHNIKQEPLEIGRNANRLHPSFPPQLTRSTFVQAPWNNMSPSPVNSIVKEEHFHSRTSASSTKPGELYSGSMGMQFGTVGSSHREKSVVASAPAIGSTQPIEIITIEDDEPIQIRSSSLPPKSAEFSSGRRGMQIRAAVGSSSHRETSVVNSVPAVGGSRSSSSGTNNSMHPTQMAATLGSKPLPTIPILSGIGSSSSVGNTSGPSVASGAVQKPLLTIPILSGIRSSSSIGNKSGPSVASGAVQKSLPTIPILSGIGPSSSIGNTSGPSVASGAVQKPLPTIPILSGTGPSSSIGNTSGPSVASGAVQKPLPTIPILSGTGPSSSIGNTSGPSVASSAVQKELDRRMRERFNKIGTLAARYKLNCKEVKIDDYKPTIRFSSGHLNHALINNNDNETLKDETCKMPLSTSNAGENVNLCKTRILKFVKEAYIHPGNEPILVPKSETKLILSERQSDGTVTMHYCEFDDYDHLAEEDLLPTFPNIHTADMFAAEFCTLMSREGFSIKDDDIQTKPVSVVQSTDGQHNCAPGPSVIAGVPPVMQDIHGQSSNDVKPLPVGSSNVAVSSTHNMWMNAEGGGFSVPSPSSPITEALDSLMQSSDAMVLTSHSVSIEQDSNMQQQLDINPMVNNTVKHPMRRRGAPRSGPRGVSPLPICNPNPGPSSVSTINAASIMDIKPRIEQRRHIVCGLPCKRSTNAGGSQSDNLQVPSGSGSGARGRGSRGRAPRGRAPVGLQRNDMGPPPRMALSNPSVLGECGEQPSNTGVLRIGNVNIDSSLISDSGSGSGSRGLLVRSSGISNSKASDMNHMQRNVMASPRIVSDVNQNQMQQMNLQPASVSPSVSSGASLPSVSATNQEGASSKDWINEEFIRSLMK